MFLSLRIAALLFAVLFAATAHAAGNKATVYQYDSAGNLVAVIDTLTDPNNCGAKENVCPAVTNGNATCTNGKCGQTCKDGFVLCGSTCLTACGSKKAKH